MSVRETSRSGLFRPQQAPGASALFNVGNRTGVGRIFGPVSAVSLKSYQVRPGRFSALPMLLSGFLFLNACGSNEPVRRHDIHERTKIASELIEHGNTRAGAAILESLREDHPQRLELMQTMGELYFTQANHIAA